MLLAPTATAIRLMQMVLCYWLLLQGINATYADDIVLLAPTARAMRLMQMVLCYWFIQLGLCDLCR